MLIFAWWSKPTENGVTISGRSSALIIFLFLGQQQIDTYSSSLKEGRRIILASEVSVHGYMVPRQKLHGEGPDWRAAYFMASHRTEKGSGKKGARAHS